MQSCPKNVHIGPLTGECKRPGALPLPPVALQLPQEPPGAAGPPSPARGSAGMPPLPSPVSNSARPNCGPPWDGRQKSTSDAGETKWDESKTKLEVKPRYKEGDVYTEDKTLWNPSEMVKPNQKNSFTGLERKDKTNESLLEISKEDRKQKLEVFSQNQGLLAISSTEMTKIPPRVHIEEIKSCLVEESKKVKTETITPPIENIEPVKKTSPAGRKRKILVEESQKNRKRKKTEVNQPLQMHNSDKVKKRKRKLDVGDENSENKVKKVKKKIVKQKDENACVDRKIVKKSQKNLVKSKAKLLKDRNETVSKEGYSDTISEVIEQVIKGQSTRKKKKFDETIASEKIVNRRKSNQEVRTVLLSEPQCIRKSKSCSPHRSKTRENSKSPIRITRDDTKRKSEVPNKSKSVKSKPEPKVKCAEKVTVEHSKTTTKNGKKNAISKPKQVSILNRSLQSSPSSVKTKRAKCDSPLSMLVLKKAVSKKLTVLPLKCSLAPKWSNGWSWDSEAFDAKVYLTVSFGCYRGFDLLC